MHHRDIIGETGMATYHAIDPATYLQSIAAPDPRQRVDDDPDADFEPVESLHRTPPPRPTRALPGSPEKIAILADRYENGKDLWHDDDLTAFAGDIYAVMD